MSVSAYAHRCTKGGGRSKTSSFELRKQPGGARKKHTTGVEVEGGEQEPSGTRAAFRHETTLLQEQLWPTGGRYSRW